MTTFSADNHSAPFGASSRQLSDDVLQSAEEAVLTNPASAEGGPPQIQPPALAPAATDRASPSPSNRDVVARYVAQNPCQSALIAVAVGALAAAAWRSALGRHRR